MLFCLAAAVHRRWPGLVAEVHCLPLAFRRSPLSPLETARRFSAFFPKGGPPKFCFREFVETPVAALAELGLFSVLRPFSVACVRVLHSRGAPVALRVRSSHCLCSEYCYP